VTAVESTLTVDLQYVLRRTNQVRTAQVTRPV
jgi:hypothetical protein